MVTSTTPIKWFGGKGKMLNKIMPVIEKIPHSVYVEPFGGGASILLAKKPCGVEVYNDLDHSLYEFFTTLANPDLFEIFQRKVMCLPYSRELFETCNKTWYELDNPIDRTVAWFVVARQSFGGLFGASWSFVTTHAANNKASACSAWLSAIERLPEVHARLQRVQIECNDFRCVFNTYDSPATLFYCDPPYVKATRRSGGYKHEMSDEDHAELVKILSQLEGSVVLSGYENDIYLPLQDNGFSVIDFDMSCYAAASTKVMKEAGRVYGNRRVERLWVKMSSAAVSSPISDEFLDFMESSNEQKEECQAAVGPDTICGDEGVCD